MSTPVFHLSATCRLLELDIIGQQLEQLAGRIAVSDVEVAVLDPSFLGAWPGIWRWLQLLSDQCCQQVAVRRAQDGW
ncbi:hypothetical protein FIBSPDRAFT_1052032 [Athelia psychrophila]|uniref:Uncharacterized protein n=1 Tax=Athelia psychrophila TaxID=1759441 RepID=A0A165XY83_9AGAM|nr:hypothetical protein FIBSPDRAFT_1052032 [Fibularhizoctonia sp. CBS 109695]